MRTKGVFMKRFLFALLLVLGVTSLALAAPVTIMDPDGQSSVKVRGGLINSPDKIVHQEDSGLLNLGPTRVHNISLFSPTTGDIIGIYNTDGNYLITDLEFEFDIGISANTTIKSNETIDLKGVLFEKGLGVLAGDPSQEVTASFDY